MFHLFNRVYLKHESLFSSGDVKSLVVMSEKSQHPLGRLLGFETAILPSFYDILESDHGNSIEKFWESILNKEPDTRFELVADSQMLNYLVIQYWKSIFKSPDVEGVFKLYNFFILDSRLKTFIYNDFSSVSRKSLVKSIQFMDKSQFVELYEKLEPVAVLRDAKKDDFSFEYLLADYVFNPQTKYLKGFKEKVRNLSWKKWMGDMDVLKGELLNDFYSIKKLVPSIDFSFDDAIHVEKYFASNESLSWMLDEKFNSRNSDYIRRKYNKNIFLDIFKNMILGSPSAENLSFQEWYADDQMLLTNLVFEEDFDAFLHIDMKRGFGCSLTGDHLRQKCNQIFVSYVYDKIRSKQAHELKHYELA